MELEDSVSSTDDQLTEEQMYEIEGEQVPQSKVSPEHFKEWHDAYTNRDNWQRTNTQKAQELSAATQEVEQLGGLKKIKERLEEYDEIEDYLEANPEVQEMVYDFMDEQDGIESEAQPQESAPDQQNSSLERRLKALEDVGKERDESAANIEERKVALVALKEKYPGLDEAKLDEYVKGLSGIGDLKGLYEFAFNASRGSNTDDLRKQVLADIKAEEAAKVETGGLNSAIDIPENIDVGNKDLDDVFDGYKKELGLQN